MLLLLCGCHKEVGDTAAFGICVFRRSLPSPLPVRTRSFSFAVTDYLEPPVPDLWGVVGYVAVITFGQSHLVNLVVEGVGHSSTPRSMRAKDVAQVPIVPLGSNFGQWHGEFTNT